MAKVKRRFVALFGVLFFVFTSPFRLAHHLLSHCLGQSNVPIFEVVYAEVITTAEEALKTFLPNAEIQKDVHILTREQMESMSQNVNFDPVLDQSFEFYIGKVAGEIVGYVGRDRVRGKWGLIHYMIYLSPEGKINDVIVLAYEEKRGRPVAKNRFLKQFRGKNFKNPIELRKDIQGVTGASISSRGMTDGIRKMVNVFEAIYG